MTLMRDLWTAGFFFPLSELSACSVPLESVIAVVGVAWCCPLCCQADAVAIGICYVLSEGWNC